MKQAVETTFTFRPVTLSQVVVWLQAIVIFVVSATIGGYAIVASERQAIFAQFATTDKQIAIVYVKVDNMSEDIREIKEILKRR